MCIVLTYDDAWNEIIDESCVSAIRNSLQHKEKITNVHENKNIFDFIFVVLFAVILSVYILIVIKIIAYINKKKSKFDLRTYIWWILCWLSINIILGYMFLSGMYIMQEYMQDKVEAKNVYHSELST